MALRRSSRLPETDRRQARSIAPTATAAGHAGCDAEASPPPRRLRSFGPPPGTDASSEQSVQHDSRAGRQPSPGPCREFDDEAVGDVRAAAVLSPGRRLGGGGDVPELPPQDDDED